MSLSKLNASYLDDAWEYFLNPPVSPVSLLKNEEWQKKGIVVYLKRDDLLFVPTHPEIAGNKWRKMWGTFKQYDRSSKWPLITQGGIHSNHLVALAAAGHLLGVRTIGIVRGENNLDISPTLQKATAYGMELHFISRNEYKSLYSSHLPSFLQESYDHFHFIPEGGSNVASALGLESLMNEINDSFSQINLQSDKNTIALPVGTGGTINGLSLHNSQKIRLLGIYVLKGFSENKMENDIVLNPDFHLGGYAKYHQGLVDFIRHFYQQHQIILDPIYSGKMMYALNEMIKTDYFSPGTTLVAIHTGGLQGLEAFNKRYKTQLPSFTTQSYPL